MMDTWLPPQPPTANPDSPLPRQPGQRWVAAAMTLIVLLGGGLGILLTRHGGSTSNAANAILNDATRGVVNINGRVSDGSIAGTGMVLSADGLVLTSNHVVAGTLSLVGQVNATGPQYKATVIGVDPSDDVAVIRLTGASGLHPVPFDTSGTVALGDSVTALGNALGRNGPPVVATGKVTSLNETLVVALEDSGDGNSGAHETLNGLIQFDASIQPGDSGGPLLNSAGHVIGMNTAGSTTKHPVNGGLFGAAIPITTALSIADQIRSGVTSAYIQGPHSGILGVRVTDAPDSSGALVHAVTGAGATAAGIKAQDVITEVAGTPIQSESDLGNVMQGRRPGDRVPVTWQDDSNKVHQAVVVLSEGPPA